jgi:hypothetical protein
LILSYNLNIFADTFNLLKLSHGEGLIVFGDVY